MSATEALDDAELLAAARAGDRAAIGKLLEQHQARLYRFGLSLCHDDEDARDVLQDTMLAAARSLPAFRGEASLSTWLYTIARSFCIKKHRKGRYAPAEERSLDEPGAEEVVDSARRPDEAFASQELRGHLERAIASLDPRYREVLLLRDVEGLTAPETAAVVGLRLDAVKTRLHRARVMLRKQLEFIVDETPATASCPDIVDLYSRHIEGDIASDLCADMERHLSGCAHCRGRCDSLRRVLALCRTSPGPAVPREVQDAVRRAVDDLLAAST